MMQSILIAFIALIFFSSPVYAYIDPGLGPMIFQGLIAFIAAIVTYFSIYWNKTKNFFKKFLKKKNVGNKEK